MRLVGTFIRLSTPFNLYSHFWTAYLMADLQNYILQIIKRRCEREILTTTNQQTIP
jgi:hypothetical protein